MQHPDLYIRKDGGIYDTKTNTQIPPPGSKGYLIRFHQDNMAGETDDGAPCYDPGWWDDTFCQNIVFNDDGTFTAENPYEDTGNMDLDLRNIWLIQPYNGETINITIVDDTITREIRS